MQSITTCDVLQIDFVTIGKDAYLLELPESLRGIVPRDYELRSSKKVSSTRPQASEGNVFVIFAPILLQI